jgi:Zn-dependent protease with chaperone function
MFFAIVAYFILPDFPENDKRLSDIERKLALRRMVEDVGEADAEKAGNSLHGFKLAMTDWKVWWMAFTLTAQVVGLSFNQYFPTLLATLGYNTTITLLLCAPPWVLAVLVTFLNARHSDKTGERFFHITIPLLFGMVGFIIALATRNLGARYFAL